MAKNKQEQKNKITGRNIYIDKHDRTIYYKKSKKQGFVIKPGTETQFRTFSNRYILGFIAIVFLEILFLHNLVISVSLGAAAIIYMEYKWHKLIDSYTMIQDFEPNEHRSSFEYIIKLDSSALILRIILYVALSICIVLNIYSNPDIESNIILVISSYIVAALGLYMAGRFIYALSKKKKQ